MPFSCRAPAPLPRRRICAAYAAAAPSYATLPLWLRGIADYRLPCGDIGFMASRLAPMRKAWHVETGFVERYLIPQGVSRPPSLQQQHPRPCARGWYLCALASPCCARTAPPPALCCLLPCPALPCPAALVGREAPFQEVRNKKSLST